jgi:hypothetical protein
MRTHSEIEMRPPCARSHHSHASARHHTPPFMASSRLECMQFEELYCLGFPCGTTLPPPPRTTTCWPNIHTCMARAGLQLSTPLLENMNVIQSVARLTSFTHSLSHIDDRGLTFLISAPCVIDSVLKHELGATPSLPCLLHSPQRCLARTM